MCQMTFQASVWVVYIVWRFPAQMEVWNAFIFKVWWPKCIKVWDIDEFQASSLETTNIFNSIIYLLFLECINVEYNYMWFVLENWLTKNKIALPKVCRFTVLKDLSVVYCASPLGYNRNFPDYPEDLRTSKKILLFIEEVT